MTTFDKRKDASEKRFVLAAEQQFKAEARRNKKLALWIAELMGKSEEAATAYVTQVIMADMEEAGDDDVFRKVRADLDEAGVELSDTALREKMDALMDEAAEEITKEA